MTKDKTSAERQESPIFVHSKVDEYGLSPAQYRTLGHVARRGECYANLDTIAHICRMHRDTAIASLALLVERGLIGKISRPGQTSVYKIRPMSEWMAPIGNEGAPENKGHLPKAGNTPPKARGTHLPESKGHEVYPIEGNPSEGNPNMSCSESFLAGLQMPEARPKPTPKDNALILINYLNEKSGRAFRESQQSMSPIIARLSESGVDLEGCKKVIERQCALWKGTQQEEYLRPETLFGKTKFDGYWAAKDLPAKRFTDGKPETPKPDHLAGF